MGTLIIAVEPAPSRSPGLTSLRLPLFARCSPHGAAGRCRGRHQFGYELTDEEAISQGIGIRESFTVDEGTRRPLPPTTVCQDDEVWLDIDGARPTLRAAPGETEDQLFAWVDDHRVLCCTVLRRQLLRLLAEPLGHSRWAVSRRRHLDRLPRKDAPVPR